LQLNPGFSILHGWLAASLAKLGQLDEARVAGARLLTLDPGFTINRWCAAVGFSPHIKDVMTDIGLALACRSRSSHKSFFIFASIALALMAARRLNNAIVAWTDLLDLATYAWLASVMWVPVVAAWTLAWNRWCQRPWRSIDVSVVVLAVAGIIGAVIHSASLTSVSRLGSIALFIVMGARIVRSGPMRILALVTLASILAALFGGELLDPIGVPGIWFPFGIGVSRTPYVYAIAIPLLAFWIVRTLTSRENASRGDAAMLRS